MNPNIDIENLGFDRGAHLLVRLALEKVPVGGEIEVTGSAPEWQTQLAAWCRNEGHKVQFKNKNSAYVARGAHESVRWEHALATGFSDSRTPYAVQEKASPAWGLAARGAKVEEGVAPIHFTLDSKKDVWSDHAPELYKQALAAQWNPDQAIDWSPPMNHSKVLENAIVQVMTYLVENENAALVVPARFLGKLHPHYREIQALLAIQVNDEARHIEIFTRRIRLYGHEPALSTVGGQSSLKTLIDEPDFTIAGFLLSVLGEGTFTNLLQFLATYGPDPVTRQICTLAARDEARHVAFGMSHILNRLNSEPELRTRLASAVQHRHDGLANTSGLNSEVFDSLILIAAGDITPVAVSEGFSRVQTLLHEMAEGRKTRLIRLGFKEREAEQLSKLHTRNFM